MTTPDEREVQRLLRRLLAESEEQFRALQIINKNILLFGRIIMFALALIAFEILLSVIVW